MGRQHDHYQARQRRVVVWGCDIHRAPAGIECQGCADQGELLSWDDIYGGRRRKR